jgi:SET domain-containing protein
VFALRAISAGETVAEYTGEVITWEEALRRHPHDPKDPHHTFYFHLECGNVIDARTHGNSSRWINHSCNPNCVSDEVQGRVFIRVLRDVQPGQELFYDYRLVIDGKYTAKLKRDYVCLCGAEACRGTLLFPKR